MKCKKCGTTQEGMFYKSIKTYCIEHWKQKVKENREKNIGHYRQYERSRTHDPERIAARNLTSNGKIGLYCVIPKGHPARPEEMSSNALYLRRNPKKRYAHEQVAYAVKTGRLKKESCEVCGEQKSHAHHDDYNKPLVVRWLCTDCHKRWHRE